MLLFYLLFGVQVNLSTEYSQNTVASSLANEGVIPDRSVEGII